jgi:hypothetical protein
MQLKSEKEHEDASPWASESFCVVAGIVSSLGFSAMLAEPRTMPATPRARRACAPRRRERGDELRHA